MNFGYWDEKHTNLCDANKNLCDIVFDKCNIKDNKNILDIGCGYGEQDFYWYNKHKCNITAIDISKKQIDYAKETAFNNNIEGVTFKLGDATDLPFNNNSFDNIICLESAFHYKPRINFFKESYRVLKPDSKMILADILVKKRDYGFFTSLFVHFFKSLLSVPSENLITVDKYVNQLENCGYEVEKINISEYTFKPYFDYFVKNNNMNIFFYKKIANIINNNIENIPLEYYIFVCKKK
tara:strand:- start:88 stop:801 length:714 start_codon:yes stop_codon:yes gene_type:complete